MAKGDDIKIKKKNKAIRKKLAKDPSAVSSRVASLIAAKKRRQSGKRRKCQGMCFSLPTPEDPFNERLGKEETSTIRNKISDEKVRSPKRMKQSIEAENGKSGCPSKFLCSCLNSVRESLVGDGVLDKEDDKPLFVDSWGVEFWKSYKLGNDVLENSGCSPSVQQLAWIASTAADHISHKENHGLSFTVPSLLFLVPSQHNASKVRSVCKPLKAFGVHTVSLHPGTSLEHQIQGLRSCEPEFLIATPDRLKDLVLLNAVDISGVSLLVVDLMDTICDCLDVVKWIKKSINGNPCTVVFQGHSGASYVQAAKSILRKQFHTLSLNKPENVMVVS